MKWLASRVFLLVLRVVGFAGRWFRGSKVASRDVGSAAPLDDTGELDGKLFAI